MTQKIIVFVGKTGTRNVIPKPNNDGMIKYGDGSNILQRKTTINM